MHLLIDVFGPDEDRADAHLEDAEAFAMALYEASGLTDDDGVAGDLLALEGDRRTVWVDFFAPKDFNATRVVGKAIDLLGARSAEFQVIDRGPHVRAPRGVVPWFTLVAPNPEPVADA